jgi:patatin-like phospholipase/acyl hydrolase
MTPPPYSARLHAPGPKRILSIDGGGVRGALAVGILRRIEETLRQSHGRPDMVLSDYFDLIGGASTAAIIAAAPPPGRDPANLEPLHRDLASKVFGQSL